MAHGPPPPQELDRLIQIVSAKGFRDHHLEVALALIDNDLSVNRGYANDKGLAPQQLLLHELLDLQGTLTTVHPRHAHIKQHHKRQMGVPFHLQACEMLKRAEAILRLVYVRPHKPDLQQLADSRLPENLLILRIDDIDVARVDLKVARGRRGSVEISHLTDRRRSPWARRGDVRPHARKRHAALCGSCHPRRKCSLLVPAAWVPTT
mmetsp:Transcript_19301/g.57985  ORF Transcript_19301/g.57985 Transcript_19301/m.57985 type:complete len:207 (+) Transcript_19301:728-1348(+)